MPRKHSAEQKGRPDSDPNVAAFDVVAKLTGTKPAEAMKAGRKRGKKKGKAPLL
jgi:hypothetical protein